MISFSCLWTGKEGLGEIFKGLYLLQYGLPTEEALRKAVAEAMAEHRRNGVPIAIRRNGQVVRIPSDQIEVRESEVEYKVSRKRRR